MLATDQRRANRSIDSNAAPATCSAPPATASPRPEAGGASPRASKAPPRTTSTIVSSSAGAKATGQQSGWQRPQCRQGQQ